MAGEIQLNSITFATESGGTVTVSNVDSATNRTNLGLGSMATQNANAVAITGGTIGSGLVFPTFVGMIASFAMSSAPTGWIICNGAEYAIADYGDLYTAIGTTWGALTNGSGGAGSTHFRVPDLRGAFLRGSGSQTYTNTYDGGSVGDKNTDTAIAHNHNINGMATQGGGGGPYQYNLNLLQRYDGTTETLNQEGLTSGGTGIISTTGRAGGSETKPFNAAINYCIKY